METATMANTDRELSISRVLNAPRELVWKVWTEPDHIKNWWGPNGFTNTIFKMEVKPGGIWDFIMHGPDGTDYKNKSVYKEVVKPERIVYDHVSGPKFQFTVTFTAQGKKTLIKIQMLFKTAAEKNKIVKEFRAGEGLEQNMYKLDAYLKKISVVKEMTITRIINAPRAIVFNAWTDAKQLAKWWGPKDFTNPVCEIDTNPGGAILIHMTSPDGTMYPMDGTVHEIIEPAKIIFSSNALDTAGNRLFEVLNTVTFNEEDGKTKLTIHAVVSELTDEGKSYTNGMIEGWNQSIDRLDELVMNNARNKIEIKSNNPIELERIFNASVEKVWQAIADSKQMKHWYFDLEDFKPEVGFKFQFAGVGKNGDTYIHLCEVKEVIPKRKLSYSWKYKGYEGSSLLTFELFDEAGKTRLKLTHEGMESFSSNGPDFARESFAEGWNHIINISLKGFLETEK